MGSRRHLARCGAKWSRAARMLAAALVAVVGVPFLSLSVGLSAGAQATTTVSGVVTWDPGPTGDYYAEVCWFQYYEDPPGVANNPSGCVQPDAAGNYTLTFDSGHLTNVYLSYNRVDGLIFPQEYWPDVRYIQVPANTSTPVTQDFHMVVRPLIRGSVTFADGTPVNRATVCAIDVLGPTSACTATDANGNYAMTVEFGGEYRVGVSSSIDAFYPEIFDDVPPSPDGSVPPGVTLITFDTGQRQTADFVVEPQPRVTGSVRYESGGIASDARVCVIPVANPLLQRCAQVDTRTGFYSIAMPTTDDVVVQVSSAGGWFAPEYYADLYTFSTTPPAETQVLSFDSGLVQTVDLFVGRYTSISGTVTDEVAGQLAEEVQVCVHQQIEPAAPSADSSRVSCVYTQGGAYSFGQLYPGTVTLTFGEGSFVYESEAWDDQPAGSGEPIMIGVGGALTGYDAALTPKYTEYTVTAGVENAVGEPLDGIEICAILESGAEVCGVSVGGSVDLAIPNGMFTLRFADPAGAYITEYWGDTTDAASASMVSAADWQASAPLTAVLEQIPATTTTTAATTTSRTTTTAGPTSTTTPAVETSTTTAATTPTTAVPGSSTTTAANSPAAVTSTTTTPAATRVLGATQTATPMSRTGGGATVLLLGLATTLLAVGLVVLGYRRGR